MCDTRVSQQELDAHYARYLQWLFLDSKARKMLQVQEKEAVVSFIMFINMDLSTKTRK